MEEAVLRALGERVTQVRGKRSQRDLAVECHLDGKTVSRIENGQYAPNVFTLLALSNALNISLAYLVHGTERVTDPCRVTVPETCHANVLSEAAATENRRLLMRLDALFAEVAEIHKRLPPRE